MYIDINVRETKNNMLIRQWTLECDDKYKCLWNTEYSSLFLDSIFDTFIEFILYIREYMNINLTDKERNTSMINLVEIFYNGYQLTHLKQILDWDRVKEALIT